MSLPDERKGEKIILISEYEGADRKTFQEKSRELGYGELYIPREVRHQRELPVPGHGKTDYVTLMEQLET